MQATATSNLSIHFIHFFILTQKSLLISFDPSSHPYLPSTTGHLPYILVASYCAQPDRPSPGEMAEYIGQGSLVVQLTAMLTGAGQLADFLGLEERYTVTNASGVIVGFLTGVSTVMSALYMKSAPRTRLLRSRMLCLLAPKTDVRMK